MTRTTSPFGVGFDEGRKFKRMTPAQSRKLNEAMRKFWNQESGKAPDQIVLHPFEAGFLKGQESGYKYGRMIGFSLGCAFAGFLTAVTLWAIFR